MKENTQEKNLVEKTKKGIFTKIKKFLKKLFNKNSENTNNEKFVEEIIQVKENSLFKENLKRTEDDETRLLELQRRYRRGEIAENDLTDDEVDALCELYDRQIEELQKSIEMREQKLADYKKRKQPKVEENNT